jgi:hypothetical protein
MKSFFRSPIIAIFMTFIITGCTALGVGGDSGVDPELVKDRPQLISNSGVQACLLGAGAGALACLAADDKATCMAVAAVAGCGVGLGANYILDSRRSEYANNEARMNAYQADVREDIKAMDTYMVKVRNVLSRNKRELARIRQDIKTASGDQKANEQQLAQFLQNEDYLKEILSELDTKIAMYNEAADQEQADGVNARQLRAEIARLQKQRDDLEREIVSAYSQGGSIRST